MDTKTKVYLVDTKSDGHRMTIRRAVQSDRVSHKNTVAQPHVRHNKLSSVKDLYSKYNDEQLPSHSSLVSQWSVCTEAPVQFRPPPTGAGLSHSLVRVRLPLPQVVLQSLHRLQSLHKPSATRNMIDA